MGERCLHSKIEMTAEAKRDANEFRKRKSIRLHCHCQSNHGVWTTAFELKIATFQRVWDASLYRLHIRAITWRVSFMQCLDPLFVDFSSSYSNICVTSYTYDVIHRTGCAWCNVSSHHRQDVNIFPFIHLTSLMRLLWLLCVVGCVMLRFIQVDKCVLSVAPTTTGMVFHSFKWIRSVCHLETNWTWKITTSTQHTLTRECTQSHAVSSTRCVRQQTIVWIRNVPDSIYVTAFS